MFQPNFAFGYVGHIPETFWLRETNPGNAHSLKYLPCTGSRSEAGRPGGDKFAARMETVMSDYLAMFLALLVYGSLFYFIWSMQ